MQGTLGETRSDVLTGIQSDTLEIEHNTPPEDLTIGQKLRYSLECKTIQHEKKTITELGRIARSDAGKKTPKIKE